MGYIAQGKTSKKRIFAAAWGGGIGEVSEEGAQESRSYIKFNLKCEIFDFR